MRRREVNANSPKEVIENVKFIKRFYPKGVVRDGDWQIVEVKSEETNETYVIVGNLVAMTDEYDATYRVGCTLGYNDKRSEWQYSVYYSQEIYEFKTVEDQRVFLGQVLTDSQLKSVFDMFPNPIEIFEKNEMEKLLEVKGIGVKTIEKIKTRYEACKDKGRAYVELGKYGISNAIIERLIERYKSPDTAVTKVKENPYVLVTDVKGIGFKKADEIARQLGMPSDSVERGVAFIRHFFSEKAIAGDSYMEYEELLKGIDDYLGVDYPDDSINEAMSRLKTSGKLWVKDCVDDDGYEYTLVGDMKYYEIEKELAYHIRRLMSAPSNVVLSDEEIEERIKAKEEGQGWTYTDRQKEGIYTTIHNNVSVITGYGGTGKTSCVAGMLACTPDDYTFEQCALSGKASVNLTDVTGYEGKTIHSLLQYNAKQDSFIRCEEYPLDTNLVLLDEGSMVEVELALALLKAIPTGAKLIILGDTNQLEAIGSGNFLMDLIDSEVVPVIVFDKVHRQGAKSAIRTESKRVAEGEQIVKQGWEGEVTLGELQDLKYIGFSRPYGSKEKRPTIDLIIKEFKALLKEAKDIKNISIIVPTKANGSGCYPINILAQDYYLPSRRGHGIELGADNQKYTIYVGDKVINLKNNRKTYYYAPTVNEFGEEVVEKVLRPIYNGNMGEVIEIIDDNTVVVDFYNIGEVIVTGKQLQEIALGYAITTHKSQGSTIPYVVGGIDYTHYSMLTRQLTYTLMSRAKTKMSLIFETSALLYSIKTNNTTHKRTFLYHILTGRLE